MPLDLSPDQLKHPRASDPTV